jgi:hypothetical protein
VLPVAAVIIVAFPLYSTVWPMPASPLNYAVYTAGAWLVIGLVLLAELAFRRPHLLATAGRLWGSE